ncbi:hypothetical protein MMC31_006349 [Peltigera leucophlebia]|nr:hypothetical protein [Peltigera leucophlebia]
MALRVTPNTPLAGALSEAVERKLLELEWHIGTDNSLRDYIILILVNGATQDQFIDILSNELFDGNPDLRLSTFSEWLFKQAVNLNEKLNRPSESRPTPPSKKRDVKRDESFRSGNILPDLLYQTRWSIFGGDERLAQKAITPLDPRSPTANPPEIAQTMHAFPATQCPCVAMEQTANGIIVNLHMPKSIASMILA